MKTNGADASFEEFNAALAKLGSGARVCASPTLHKMLVSDLDGKAIGELPVHALPDVVDAAVRLIEKSFEEGVQTGRALERAGR